MKKSVLFLYASFVLMAAGVTGALASDDFGGPEITFNSPAKGVTFSHKAHVGDMGLDCDSCHEGLFEMEAHAAESKGDFTMASFAQGRYCGACHNGEMAFSSNTQCASCHADGGEIIFEKPVMGVLFSHQYHGNELGLECDSCHNQLFQMKRAAEENADFTMESLYQGMYCGACHDGQTAFASNTRCATCHIGVKGYKRNSSAAGESEKGHHGGH